MAITSVDPQAVPRQLFPDADEVQGNLGNFLFWYDFSDSRNLVVQQSVLYAAAPRPEALVNVVVRADDPTTNAMTTDFINGVLSHSGTSADMFEGVNTVTATSQMTAFLVVAGDTEDVIFQLGSLILWNTKAEIGGGTQGYFQSGDTGNPHILVVRWNGTSGNVESKRDDGDFALIASDHTDFHSNPSVVYVAGTSEGPPSPGFDGKLGEVMVSADHMTFAEMNKVGNYLCNKWQISWSDITEVINP